ncbi:MAG: hypothetical protein C0601_07145 [Candidatus Muiribacterium halophilum]|uniref:Clostripain n=1 Tax=Muiribacterium halophilum TaxID=2053465 RepID=A0A2N5ZFW1_MUIH1|nr:MAG: hypothetical protein C0601_07145 [Candidatus Muirbacterium halophilum]
MKKITLLFLCLFIFSNLILADDEAPTVKEWTVMVYMCADNDLEAFALQDLNELEMVGSTDNLNIIALVDRWDGYHWVFGDNGPERVRADRGDTTAEGNWTGAKIFYITKDDDMNRINSPEIADMGEIDTGNPRNIQAFTGVIGENFPAKNYMIIICNHGNGIQGVGYDDTASIDGKLTDGKYVYMDGSKLTGPELGQVFSNVVSRIAQEEKDYIDVVGFDACLMSMYSNHVQLGKNNVRAVIGSQELEPGNGWPYHTIMYVLKRYTDENRTLSEATFADWVVRLYMDSYEGDDVTLSGINTTERGFDAVTEKIDALCELLVADDDNMLKLHTAAKETQRYHSGSNAGGSFAYYVDLIDLMKKIESEFDGDIADAAADVRSAIVANHIILANRSEGNRVADSNGIAIYFPLYRRKRTEEGAYLVRPYISAEYNGYKTDRQIFRSFDFGANSKYDELLLKYYDVLERKTDDEVGLY